MNRNHHALIDGLESSGSEFVRYLQRLSKQDLSVAPTPGDWTMHQVAAHVRDVEQQVFLSRSKRIPSENLPTVQNFDQDVWDREHYSSTEGIAKIVSEFRVARRKQIASLRKTKDKDWLRCAMHSTYGRISLEWLVMHNYHHTLEHLAQRGYTQEGALLKHLNRQGTHDGI